MAPESQGAPLCCHQTKAGQISPDRRFILEPSVPRAPRVHGWSVATLSHSHCSSWSQGAHWSSAGLPVQAAEGTGQLRRGLGWHRAMGATPLCSRELGETGMGLGQLQGAHMRSPGRDFSSFYSDAALSWLCPSGQRLCWTHNSSQGMQVRPGYSSGCLWELFPGLSLHVNLACSPSALRKLRSYSLGREKNGLFFLPKFGRENPIRIMVCVGLMEMPGDSDTASSLLQRCWRV